MYDLKGRLRKLSEVFATELGEVGGEENENSCEDFTGDDESG